MDAWLHVAMGNNERAIKALREWRDLGGCLDLRQVRIFPNSLFDSAEFQALNDEMLAALAEQRANLARVIGPDSEHLTHPNWRQAREN